VAADGPKHTVAKHRRWVRLRHCVRQLLDDASERSHFRAALGAALQVRFKRATFVRGERPQHIQASRFAERVVLDAVHLVANRSFIFNSP
jgi:hypothetical protein